MPFVYGSSALAYEAPRIEAAFRVPPGPVDPTHTQFEVLPITDPDTAEPLGSVARVPVYEGTTLTGTATYPWYETARLTSGTNSTLSAADIRNVSVRLTASTTAFTAGLVQLTTTFNTASNATWQLTNLLSQQMLDAFRGVTLNLTNTTWYDPPILSPEERARLARRKARAQTRARKLLAEHLTAQELDQLAASGYFEVESTTSGRRYRIYRGYSRNIVELDAKGKPIARLCAHPSGALPDEDHMLAQRLYLQVAEDAFRKIANRSPIGTVEAARLVA